MNTVTRRGKVSAFLRVSAAAALSAVLLSGGGCGDRELPDITDNSITGAQPAQKAAEGEVTKSSLLASVGDRFDPAMLGLQPGGTVSELRFNWYSATGDANSQSFVRVFEGDALVASAEGTSGTAVENYLWHKADVSGLKPGTAYTYWVSNDGVNWSNEYEYKSPPATGLFRFAAISDAQFDGSVSSRVAGTTPESDLSQWLAIAEKIAGEGVSLIVNAGDHVEYCQNSASVSGRGETSYEYYFRPPMLRKIPTAPVMGNHDQCENFDYHFNPPNASDKVKLTGGQGSGTYYFSNYYFLSNRVLFVGLNTAPPTNDATTAGFVDAYRATIQQAKTAHFGKYDFLVVTHHKTTTSTSYYGHAFDSDIISYVNGGLQKMMTSEGVDVVFTGHDHMYVKSRLIDNDSVDLADEDQVKRSTLYLTLKPSGRTRNYNCDGNGANCFSDVGFDVAASNRSTYVSSYPFLQKHWRTGTSASDNGKELYVPWSLKDISLYNPSQPGYAIVEVAYGKMTIKIKDHNGDTYDTIELERKSPIGIIATGRLSK